MLTSGTNAPSFLSSHHKLAAVAKQENVVSIKTERERSLSINHSSRVNLSLASHSKPVWEPLDCRFF